MPTILLKHTKLAMLAFAILLIAATYFFSISHTVDALSERDRLSSLAAENGSLSLQPGYLERQSANLQKLISQMSFDSTAYRSALSSYAGLAADLEQVRVVSVSDIAVKASDPRFMVQHVIFAGNFPSLLRLYSRLERDKKFGIIQSATMHYPEGRQELKPDGLELVLAFVAVKR